MTPFDSGTPQACSACGAALVPGDAFCMTCGQPAGISASAAQGAAPMAAACAACGATLEPGDTFCMTCGQPAGAGGLAFQPGAATASTCAHCGAALVPGDAFCMTCGGPVGASGAAAPIMVPAASGVAESCAFCGAALLADDAFCMGCGRAASSGSRPGSFAPSSSYGATAVTAAMAPRPATPAVASGVLIDAATPNKCPACGIQLSEAERFCRGCGRLIKRAKG
jgi:predicted amidophosphoribosyltransferase